jgi:hypothetical protein
MGIGQIPGIAPIGGMKAERIDAQMPTVFHIDGSAKTGDDKGQGKGRQATSLEAVAEDELMAKEESEGGLEATPEEDSAKSVDYFA